MDKARNLNIVTKKKNNPFYLIDPELRSRAESLIESNFSDHVATLRPDERSNFLLDVINDIIDADELVEGFVLERHVERNRKKVDEKDES